MSEGCKADYLQTVRGGGGVGERGGKADAYLRGEGGGQPGGAGGTEGEETAALLAHSRTSSSDGD